MPATESSSSANAALVSESAVLPFSRLIAPSGKVAREVTPTVGRVSFWTRGRQPFQEWRRAYSDTFRHAGRVQGLLLVLAAPGPLCLWSSGIKPRLACRAREVFALLLSSPPGSLSREGAPLPTATGIAQERPRRLRGYPPAPKPLAPVLAHPCPPGAPLETNEQTLKD